jgi:hypothetical protein
MKAPLRANPKASARWDELLTGIASSIAMHGYWSSEAGSLRDAAGYHRLRVRVWEDIVNRLRVAGFDAAPEFGGTPFESAYVTVHALGWRDWQEAGEALLDEYVRAEKTIPNFGFERERRVREVAIGRWSLLQVKNGRRLDRTEP